MEGKGVFIWVHIKYFNSRMMAESMKANMQMIKRKGRVLFTGPMVDSTKVSGKMENK